MTQSQWPMIVFVGTLWAAIIWLVIDLILELRREKRKPLDDE